MDQQERLDYLVERFKEDSVQYRDLKTPRDLVGKKQILRSLMNIRMPKPLPPKVLKIQDEYLQERNRENGIVDLTEVPTKLIPKCPDNDSDVRMKEAYCPEQIEKQSICIDGDSGEVIRRLL